MSISDYLEPKILDAVFNNTSLAVASVYAKLHTGDPGEAGTSNAFADTTRIVTSWAAASGGTITTDAATTWTNLSSGGTLTHISLWDASTAGNHLWNGALTSSKTVNAADDFTIATGDIDVTLD